MTEQDLYIATLYRVKLNIQDCLKCSSLGFFDLNLKGPFFKSSLEFSPFAVLFYFDWSGESQCTCLSEQIH